MRLQPLLPLLLSALLLSTPPVAASSYRVTEGRIEQDGGQLTTGDEGAVLLFPSGTRLSVGANARLVGPRSVQLVLGVRQRTPAQIFSLLSGRVDVELGTELDPTPIVFRTGHITAAILGGRGVAWRESGQSIVGAQQGKVLVSQDGPWVELAPSQAVIIRPEEEWMWASLPERPHVNAEQRVWLARHGHVAVGGFAWPAVNNAKDYDVRLTRTDTERVVHHEVTSDTVLNHGWLRLPPGSYSLQVRANGHLGLSGKDSPATQFHVVGVDTRPGSFVDEAGTVRVVKRYHANFSYVDGLQMRFGTNPRWNGATSSVPLYHSKRTSVHFRHPESNQAITSWVEPNDLTAEIQLSPTRPSWPKDQVRVDIQLRDESDRQRESTWSPRVEVSIGLEPQALKWNREGGRLWVDLPPQQGDGPWVVRVLVQDKHGGELARDFLEVTSSAITQPARKEIK